MIKSEIYLILLKKFIAVKTSKFVIIIKIHDLILYILRDNINIFFSRPFQRRLPKLQISIFCFAVHFLSCALKNTEKYFIQNL